MISLKNIHFNNSSDKINISFGNGVTILSYEKRNIFKGLSIKDQTFSGDEFLVDNINYLNNNEKQFLVFDIKARIVNIRAIFLKKDEEKEQFFKQLTEQLLPLKDFNISSLENKMGKIFAIFEILKSFGVCYALIDHNDSINYENENLINQSLKKMDEHDFPIIVLENEIFEDDDDIISLEDMPIIVIGGKDDGKIITDKQKNDKKSSVNKDEKFFPRFFKFIKKNISLVILSLLEATFIVFTSLLSMYYFSLNDTMWGVILLLVMIICFGTYILFNTYLFPKKIENNAYQIKKKILFDVFNVLFIALSYVIFFVLINMKIFKESETFNVSHMVLSFVIVPLILMVPFVSKYIALGFDKIKRLFNKTNN